MTRRPTGDELLVRRAARTVALQAAALVGAGTIALVVLVTVVVVAGQSAAADRLLRGTVATADDVGDPPPGAFLVLSDDARTRASAGLPEGLEDGLAALRRRSGPGTTLRELTADGVHYRVATRATDGRTTQAVLDLTPTRQERARLLRAMGVAGLLALVLAAGLGVLVGRRAVRPLVQALSLQRAFVADAGHELRTPLTLLSTRAQLLDRSLQASGDLQLRADSSGVVHDVARLGEVLEDLLVAADPASTRSVEPVDVGPLVAEVVDSADAHAAQAGVRLEVRQDGDGCVVQASAVALRRAVLALVDNAVDHTPAGGEVRVAVRLDGADVAITVHDTGPGVAPHLADQVLRRFSSGGHRAGRAHYGLGLALTAGVADRYGGRLRLVPVDTGACFELRLPADR